MEGDMTMNLFTHYRQRENHCTNVLLNLLAMNEAILLKPFLEKLIPGAKKLVLKDVRFLLFTENPPAEIKPFEYVIGVAPFLRKKTQEETIPNPGSIPDAWILGQNFTLQFEFKVTGALNNAQSAAHREKLPNAQEVEITWKQVGKALRGLQAEGTTKWLIDQFCEVIADLESPRPASGMPKQIISHRKAQPNEPFFVISGNKRLGKYNIENVSPGAQERKLLTNGIGIQESRRWIQKYIQSNEEPGIYLTEDNVVIDCCIDPDSRIESWNRWRLGSY
ncbi:hypothetical protein [Paenibacillus sp. GbtcB18]|uniref:hypothetical protein n=1 Tax=Paenibacillus sp. GbtcB18 TaxID=2824763 RepID=UPI001C308016|nr:hypothetical protein [Paenibacillus sp. GbtcB18]